MSLIFYKDKFVFNSIHCFSALFLISTAVTLFADSSSASLIYVRGYIETIGLMFLITVKKYNENEIKAFEIAQLMLLFVMICLGFAGADWYGGRNTMTIFGATSDPNYFIGFFILPTTVALKKLRENKIYAVICSVMILLTGYIVLSSGSRGGLLAWIVTVVSYVFINAKSAKQRLIGMAAAFFAAVALWTIVIPLLPETVSSRFSIEAVLKSRGTARADIWESMFETIRNSTWELLSGRGITAYHRMVVDGRVEYVVAHNQFIQALYNQGILGFLSFALMSFAAVLRNIKKRGYISSAMLGMLALAMTLSVNPSIKSYWNLLIYSAFCFQTSESTEGS